MFVLDLLRGVGRVLTTASIAEFLEPFYGLYWCMSRQKKGRFWGEADAAYLSSGSNQVHVRGLLVDCRYWLVFPVKACVEVYWRCADWEVELVAWIASAGTWWSGRLHGSGMGHLPWLILWRLLRLNLGAREKHLTSQLSWITAWLLVTRVCSVCLVNVLLLLFCTPYDWNNGGSVDVFMRRGCCDYSNCSPLCQYGCQKLRNFCRSHESPTAKMVGMVLVLWGVCAILGNWYGI